jgi:PAS domain S-box-containing protein
MDLTGRFTYVNGQLCAALGYARDDLLTKRVQEVTHPDDLPRFSVQFDALVAGGPDFQAEIRGVRRNGGSVWMSTRLSGIRDDKDALQSLVSISFDMSERKRLEAEISRHDIQVASALDAVTRLYGVATLYVGQRSVQAVLDEVVRVAMAISNADMGTLQLFDDSGNLRIVAQHGMPATYVDYHRATNGKQRPGWAALQRRERVVISNAGESGELNDKDASRVLREAGVGALQSTPLIGRFDALLGVITTCYRTAHEPPERSLRLLDLLARQTAQVGERAWADQGRKADS